MNPKQLQRTAFGSVLVVALLSGCTFIGSQSSTHQSSQGMKGAPQAGEAAVGGGSYLEEKLPGEIASLELFDQNGKKFTLSSLEGKYIVLTNFLTSCQEICPMTTANMRTIGNAVSKSELKNVVNVLEVSVDAQRDSVSRLKAYFDLFDASTFTLASGSSNNLEQLWKYFGAPAVRTTLDSKVAASLPLDWQTGKPATYDMMHPDLVVIIDPDQKWRWLNLGNPNPGKATIPEKLKAYLSDEGQANLAKPQEPSWTVESVYSALSDLTGVKIS